jgi:hypothetical protein
MNKPKKSLMVYIAKKVRHTERILSLAGNHRTFRGSSLMAVADAKT